MFSDKNVLKVRIYGAEYELRSREDISRMEEVADYVDQTMREVDRIVRVDSSLKVAILASVNITYDLFSAQKEIEDLRAEYEDKIKKLNELLAQHLSTKSEST